MKKPRINNIEPIEFEEQNIIIAKNQPQYIPLPTHFHNDPEGSATFCWKLSHEEIQKIVETGVLWHTVLTFAKPLQPQLLSVDKPIMRIDGDKNEE